MFDIGFWEITLIAVVALLVVGPQEFPALVRNIGRLLGRVRRFVGSVKTEFETEINKAEEIKQRIAEEARIAEAHKILDEKRFAAVRAEETAKASVTGSGAPSPSPADGNKNEAAKT
ncbi:MAG TPA: twin-arginine translocase subunit TatB [Gammaproteobacteria bacterium]|nr:twin-arginine translocase subunit TatB [Gammaproteobacteria bacterium]